MSKKILLSLILAFLILSFRFNLVGAQNINSITDTAIEVPVSDQNAQNGSLICSDTNGYSLCQNEYDSSIYGVVDSNASTAFITKVPNGKIIVTKGQTTLKVSSATGDIKKGDFLTSSKTPGVAELAKNTGYVIGTALADYSSADKTAVKTIPVALNIHARINVTTNTKDNLLDILRSGLGGLGVSPIAALRYILASAMVLTSFVIGFLYFGRIAKTGVEAIGRNPLAGVRIQMSVLINVAIMLGIVAAGLAVAYLILAL